MPILKVDEARKLAQEQIDSITASTGVECVLLERSTETEKGWVFFYNSKEFIETGHISFALAGNGPLLVAPDGTVRHLGSARPWQEEFLNVCPKCGSAVNAVIGQHVWPDDRLAWSRSNACGACGVTTEEDGSGEPPATIRQLLLEKEGTWGMLLSKSSDKLSAVAMLRKLFEFDLKAATALLRSPSLELWRGTQVECIWLGKHMQRIGIETAVERVQEVIENGS
jgi:hypothetical protein